MAESGTLGSLPPAARPGRPTEGRPSLWTPGLPLVARGCVRARTHTSTHVCACTRRHVHLRTQTPKASSQVRGDWSPAAREENSQTPSDEGGSLPSRLDGFLLGRLLIQFIILIGERRTVI